MADFSFNNRSDLIGERRAVESRKLCEIRSISDNP
jgi:hypothetical protein